jgi:hypothetical protein
MSIIASGNTINTSLTYTADTTGNLQLQTVGTTAVTYDTNQNAIHTGSISSVNTFGYKNRIINGNMAIAQRGTGSIAVDNGNWYYPVDRMGCYANPTGSKFTAQQNAGSVTPPAGFTNYLGMTSTSAYTIGASEYCAVRQIIEGFNVADLGWGTANAKTVTLSFWARSSLTGTFGGAIYNGDGSRSYPFSYSLPVANTWTQISITIPGDTTGTWNSTNGASITPSFSMGTGSSLSGTAGTWASAYYASSTGATSVVGTSGATFYITGVQLEVGTKAASFDYRDYGNELRMCQRYFYSITGNGGYAGVMQCYTSTAFFGKAMDLPVTMRAIPTSTATGSWTTNNSAGSGVAFTAPTSFYNTTQSISFIGTGASGLSAGNATGVNFGSGNTITASAEL